MRTLLIDNYDSYTFNLCHLLAEVNGREPVVVAHDAAEVGELDLDRYEAVVISPGAGDPRRARDFGVCRDVLLKTNLPVLGVCLGHQGIAVAEGGGVVRAPQARHGYVTRVEHGGEELFAGIPSGFGAVRYHSLCVAEPLPPELAVTARAEDGVVMALRHQRLPRWGVQFHPESIETEFGCRLLENFRALAAGRGASGSSVARAPAVGEAASGHSGASATSQRTKAVRAGTAGPGHAGSVNPNRAATPARTTAAADRAGAVKPSDTDAAAPARTAATLHYTAHVRELPGAIDADAAFTRLFAASETAFWLDSSRVEPGMARFSFFGDGSGPLAETVRHRVGESPPLFDELRAQLARREVSAPPLPFDFVGGYVGYSGYELKAECGGDARHRADTPDARWLFADRFVAVDHEQDATYLVALSTGAETARGAAAWLDETGRELRTLPASPDPLAGHRGTSAVEPDRESYLAAVECCRESLLAGESYEICLTTGAEFAAVDGGFEAYRRLRTLNPAPYSAFLRFDDVEVACSSPERFLKVSGGVAEAKPIKGTAPRGDSPESDARLRADLAADPKCRAENLMIVDLLRNDLGRVCRPGSVHVPVLMEVQSYQTVHQLVSTVRGEIDDGRDAVDCVRACFPGGSMTGAPKRRTMELIDDVEQRARGVYSGALGFLSLNGAADLNIVIRTLVRSGGKWRTGAGGAIVLGSDPAAEYEEMLLKAAAPAPALSIMD